MANSDPEKRKKYRSYLNPSRVATHEAHAAHQAVRRALLKGVLTRPDSCPSCGGTESRIEASHRDYSLPLDIEWLCAKCHRRRDRENPVGGTTPPELKERRMRPRGSGPVHGSITGYSYHKCRCDLCRRAWADLAIARRVSAA